MTGRISGTPPYFFTLGGAFLFSLPGSADIHHVLLRVSPVPCRAAGRLKDLFFPVVFLQESPSRRNDERAVSDPLKGSVDSRIITISRWTGKRVQGEEESSALHMSLVDSGFAFAISAIA